MTKQAERPCLIDFTGGGAFDDEDLATLRLNANDVVEWKTGECIPELGASIFQVVFKGYPITDEGTLTHLGSVLYDACDYGLEIHQIIGDALYEARHPWLDYADALEKGVFNKVQNVKCLKGFIIGSFQVSNIIAKGQEMNQGEGFFVAFKPIKPFDFHYFKQVKVWQPSENVL